MSVSRLLRFSLLVTAALGCSSDVTSPQLHAFVYSAAAGGCGPAGGPVVVIFLSPVPVVEINPSPPYVWMSVPVGASELTAHAWPIGSNTDARAWFKVSSTSDIPASGSMTVNSVNGDSVDGSLDLQFDDAERMTTEFHAKWLADTFYCI